jgi:amino acid transporter
MVAVSFGSYATEMFTGDSKVWAKVFAALIIIAMTAVNVVGSKLVANAQKVIVSPWCSGWTPSPPSEAPSHC